MTSISLQCSKPYTISIPRLLQNMSYIVMDVGSRGLAQVVEQVTQSGCQGIAQAWRYEGHDQTQQTIEIVTEHGLIQYVFSAHPFPIC